MTVIATLPSTTASDVNTAAAIAQRMRAWNVGRIFTNPRGALNDANEALTAAEAADSALALAHSLLVAGGAQAFLGNSDTAFDQLERARTLFRSIGDEWGDLNGVAPDECRLGKQRSAAKRLA